MPEIDMPDDLVPEQIIIGALTTKQWHMLHCLLMCYESPYTTSGEKPAREQDEQEHRQLEKTVERILAEGSHVL
jgi:hypothetical protein